MAIQHFGYVPNPTHNEQLIAQMPSFEACAGDLDFDPNKDALPYRALYVCNGGKAEPRNQGSVGSCVGNGSASAADITECSQIVFERQPYKWMARFAADAFYGLARQESGQLGGDDGSYGGAACLAAKWGVPHMLKYDDADLTQYSADRCRQYANRGLPSGLRAVGHEHQIKTTTLVTTTEQAHALLAHGYGISICSGQGFSSTRDKDGFARASGSWSHCMCLIGRRVTGRKGFLVWNSWGPDWVSGPLWQDQPEGSFYAEDDTINHMLSGRDTFAYSAYDGFPRQELDWSKIANV